MIPHLTVPLALNGTRFATVEDGTIDEVEQNVRVIIMSHAGERLMVPTFGAPSPLFDPVSRIPDRAAIESAVAEWEPRAALDFTEGAAAVDGTVNVKITVGMVG